MYALLALALVIGAVGGFLIVGDVFGAAQYRAPTPTVIAEPSPEESSGDPASTEDSITEPPLSQGTETSAPEVPEAAPPIPFVPEQIHIPSVEVSTIVEPAPATNQFNRFIGETVLTFPVPEGPFTTVWWEEGPQPGDDGLAVILGHARAPRPAVFNALPSLSPGATVGLSGRAEDEEPVVARYVVTQVVTGISKTDGMALRAVLDAPPEGATLALITCSGDVDSALYSREDNTVVFATLDATYRE